MNNTRHENSNQFKDGLWMDLHPLQVPNTVLTDNLNGTFITYNGNEYSLQNDMGNFKLKNCKLKPGYLPISTASYADTIYILSYNPIDNNIELGSYPSPLQYSDSKTQGHRQMLGVLENYLRGYIAATGVDHIVEPISVSWETLNNYVGSVNFNDPSFKLKSGDEYILNITSSDGLCGFEDLTYKVIFDNGQSQPFSAKQNTYDFTPVPWNTPGRIEISNHLFKVDKASYKVTSKQMFTNRYEISVLYELFITDEALIKKLDQEKDTIFLNTSSDYINFDVKIDDLPGSITKITVEPWLNEYRKIRCKIKFEIPKTDDSDLTKDRTLQIQSEFMTKFKISSESDEIPSKLYQVQIILNDCCVTDTVTLEGFSNNQIGSDLFYWNSENKLVVSGTNISDSQPYYKVDKIILSGQEISIENEQPWTTFDFSDAGEAKLPKQECDNNIYVWSFGRRIITNDVEVKPLSLIIKDNELTTNIDEGESDWWILKNEEKYYLKSEFFESYSKTWSILKYDGLGPILYRSADWILLDASENKFVRNENISVESEYVMLNYDHDKMDLFWINEHGADFSDKRFDKISFNTIICDWAKNEYGIDSMKIDVLCNDDSMYQLYGDKMNDSGAYYKYFQRFVDAESGTKTGIFYPSIVPINFFNNEDKSTSSFEIPRQITLSLKLDNFKSSSNNLFLGLTANQLGTKVKYNERKDISNTFNLANLSENITFSNVKLWNKIDGQVSQLGDNFYFTDKLLYYKLKCNPVEDWSSFYTVNKDQDGKMKEYTNDFSIDGYKFLWKSLDVNNYRAIRMGYPYKNPTNVVGKEIGNSNEFGCRQMDFFGQIHKNADTFNWSNLKIPGICQYISQFHKCVRYFLDISWKTPTAVNASEKSELGLCVTPESSYQGCISKLSATTFYRDKAQRASFTNSKDVIIIPNWDKWSKDDSGEGSGDDRHYTVNKYFITLPIYCSNDTVEKARMKTRKFDGKSIYETMTHGKDWEDWWKISSAEQHSYPHYESTNTEFAGIGFVNQNDSTSYLDWYVAWIPGWEDLPEEEQKYKLCSQTTIKFAPNWMHPLDGSNPDWCGKCLIEINNDLFDKIKTLILTTYSKIDNPVINSNRIVLLEQDVWDESVWDKQKLEKYINKLTMYCEDDYNSLLSHPVFRTFIKTRGSAPARIVKYPVAGIYPTTTESVKDAFSGIYEFKIWRKFYVDGEGRPFLINRESEKDIYVCKNANKKIFGYFPYFGDE